MCDCVALLVVVVVVIICCNKMLTHFLVGAVTRLLGSTNRKAEITSLKTVI